MYYNVPVMLPGAYLHVARSCIQRYLQDQVIQQLFVLEKGPKNG